MEDDCQDTNSPANGFARRAYRSLDWPLVAVHPLPAHGENSFEDLADARMYMKIQHVGEKLAMLSARFKSVSSCKHGSYRTMRNSGRRGKKDAQNEGITQNVLERKWDTKLT